MTTKHQTHQPIVALSMRTDLNNHGLRESRIEHSWFTFVSELFSQDPLVFLIPNTNTEVTFFRYFKPDLILLSGGNDIAQSGNTESSYKTRDFIESELILNNPNVPVMGVCRGFQLINSLLGGIVNQASNHAGTSHEVEILDNFKIANYPSKFVTNSFHNWVIKESDLADNLEAIAKSHDGSIEAAKHKEKPWFMTMWHPERANTGEIQRAWVLDYLRSFVSIGGWV